MATLIKRVNYASDGSRADLSGPELLAGVDAESFFVRAQDGQLNAYDLDFNPKGSPVAAPARCAAVGRAGSLAFLLPGEALFLRADGREISRIPFTVLKEDAIMGLAFDRSAKTFWTVLGTAQNCVLFAFDVEGGYSASHPMPFAGRVWLLPDWEADRAMLVGRHSDSCMTDVAEHSLERDISRGAWRALSLGNFEHVHPVHCRSGRVSGLSDTHFVVFPPDPTEVEIGPAAPNTGHIKSELSTADRFVLVVEKGVLVYDAATFARIGAVPCPPIGGGPCGISAIPLARNRIAVARRRAMWRREGSGGLDPAWYDEPTIIELWQL